MSKRNKEIKVCQECGEEFSYEFKHASVKYCGDECRKAVSSRYRKNNRNSQVNTPEYKYRIYKSNAARRGYSFELSFDEFMTHWQQDCYYCGDPIEFIGIDRKDNSIGYIVDNTNPCCTVCNVTKHTQTHQGFVDRCKRIASKHSGEPELFF